MSLYPEWELAHHTNKATERGGCRVIWLTTRDGDPAAFQLYARHYSFRDYADGRRHNTSNPNRKLFAGPGGKMVLVTLAYDALFVWRKFKDDSGQVGINCAVFRNESNYLASEMIREAEMLAWNRWKGERLYTYVNPRAIKSSNPGYCFIRAGWRKCGKTKGGLIIVEKLPSGEEVGE
jgi:hypothetical protein